MPIPTRLPVPPGAIPSTANPSALSAFQRHCLDRFHDALQNVSATEGKASLIWLQESFKQAARFNDPDRAEYREIQTKLEEAARSFIDAIAPDGEIVETTLAFLAKVPDQFGQLMGLDAVRALVGRLVRRGDAHAEAALDAAGNLLVADPHDQSSTRLADMVLEAAASLRNSKLLLRKCVAVIEAIADPHIAAPLAGVVARGCMQQIEKPMLGVDTSTPALALCDLLAYIAEPLKTGALERLIGCPISSERRWSDTVPLAVRSIANEQDRERLQARLHLILLARAAKPPYPPDIARELNVFRELIHIDRGTDARVLEALLAANSVFQHSGSITAEHLDEIAVLSFHINPEGELLIPGTQKRDQTNATNTDWLTGGTQFTYPQWLSDRRAILQREAPALISGRIRDLISPIPIEVRAVAEIPELYVGLPVRPSDWPALLGVLQQHRAALPAVSG